MLPPRTPRPTSRLRGFSMVELIVVIVMMGVLMAIAVPAYSSFIKNAKSEATTAQAPAPEPEPEPQVSDPDDELDAPSAALFQWALLGLLGLGLVGGVGTLAARTHAARRVSLAERGAEATRLELLHTRHDAVLSEWAHFETSLLETFAKPTLADVSVPATAAFHTARVRAKDLRLVLTHHSSIETLTRYEEAVTALELAWQTANERATQIGLSTLAPEQAAKVTKARDLLNLALNPGATEHERQLAYRRACDLVEGIITLPRRALLALEEIHQLALPAGSSSSVSLTKP